MQALERVPNNSFQARHAATLTSIGTGRFAGTGGPAERRGLEMNNFRKLIRDDSGAAAAEYALILAIVGAAIVIAAIGLGNAVAGAMNTASDCITTTANCKTNTAPS